MTTLVESLSSKIDEKLAAFEKRQVATEYKVGDIVKMLALVESFTATYDSEAVQARTEIHQVSQSLGETRVLTNCLEQKLHYIERELNWLASALPKQAKKGNGLVTLTEKSSEYQSSATASQATL